MLRMLPPATFSCASRCGSSRSAGVSAGKMRRQISARCAASGNGKWTTKRRRRRKAWSSALLHVGRQDRQAAVRLHALQQVADLDVGVAVVAVLDLAALAEQRVGLVEEQDRAALLRRVEDPPQVLLRLADVLADDRAQVDPVEVEPQLVREHLGGHRLAGAARAGEERADAEAARALRGESPVLVDRRALADVGGDLAQGLELRLREHEVVPARRRARCAARDRRAVVEPARGRRPRRCFLPERVQRRRQRRRLPT